MEIRPPFPGTGHIAPPSRAARLIVAGIYVIALIAAPLIVRYAPAPVAPPAAPLAVTVSTSPADPACSRGDVRCATRR